MLDKRLSLPCVFLLFAAATATVAADPAARWIHPACSPLGIEKNGPFVQRADGTLLVIDRDKLRTSTDGGKTWSAPGPSIAPGVKLDHVGHVGQFLETRDGALVVLYLDFTGYEFSWDNARQRPNPECKLELWAIRSMDGGKTWTNRQRLLDGYNADFMGLIQTSTGRLVVTVEHLAPELARWLACSFFSDDNGATWARSNWIDLGGHGHHDGAVEPMVVELRDGRLRMLIRTSLDRFWSALSDDGGASWREVRPTSLDASSAPGWLRRLASGRLALVWNRIKAAGAKEVRRSNWAGPAFAQPASLHREELSIAFSNDDGTTWSKPVVLARQPGGQLSYPYLMERTPGELWIFTRYTFDAKRQPAPPLAVRVREVDLLAGGSFVVGACTHFSQGKGDLEPNLALVRRAGIGSIRDELSWASVERQRGQLVMQPGRDAYLRRATALGIDPLLILDYGNPHYDDGAHPRSDDAIEGFCRYAEFMVRSLGKDVRLYEIWNEWDIGIGLRKRAHGSAEDYFRLLKAVYPRIKAIDPDVTVLGAGGPTSGGVDRGWLEDLVKLGAMRYCDILSIHSYNYSPPGAAGGPEAWARWVEKVQAMLRTYNDGHDVPFHITEMGWPSHVGKRGRSAETCAAYLARMFLLARGMPYVRGIWWYDFQNDGWNREHNEHNFGLVRADLTPKPAYHALASVAPLVTRDRYVGRVETDDEAVIALRFAGLAGETWAIWCADDRPRQVVIEKDSAAPDGDLSIAEVGRQPIAIPWGFRPWAENQGAKTAPDQLSLVAGAIPVLVSGELEGARVARVSMRAAQREKNRTSHE